MCLGLKIGENCWLWFPKKKQFEKGIVVSIKKGIDVVKSLKDNKKYLAPYYNVPFIRKPKELPEVLFYTYNNIDALEEMKRIINKK